MAFRRSSCAPATMGDRGGITVKAGSLYRDLSVVPGKERFDVLLETKTIRLERIVSSVRATPGAEWFDQEWAEWVLLLKGSAGLRVEGLSEVNVLRPGDYVYLPAHVRHRVEWTDPQTETIWLALHYVP